MSLDTENGQTAAPVSNQDNDNMSASNRYHNNYTNDDARSQHSADSRLTRTGSTANLISSSPPIDKYNLVCICFAILGITTLLPWNFFITATDYWMYKFRNITDNKQPDGTEPAARTPMQTFFESYLSIAANAPMLLSMVLNSLYGQKFSQKTRLYVSLAVMLVVFMMTTIFVKIDTDNIQNVFFAITMILVVVVTIFSSIFQAAMFGIVASFPSNCMHAMVNGQAIAGLLAVVIQMLALANDVAPTTSGLGYFLASTVFLSFAIMCYRYMDNDYTRYYLLKAPNNTDERGSRTSLNLLHNKSELIETLNSCWPMAASVTLVFWATLAVFPGVCVLVVPEYPNTSIWTGRFFIPITTFLLFNLGDLAGRMTSTYLPYPIERTRTLLTLASSRFIITLLLIFCNVHPRYHTPTLFKSDLFFPMFNTLLSFTNGYIFSSAMVVASSSSTRERLELTGFIMATALGVGLTLGSVTSNLLLRII